MPRSSRLAPIVAGYPRLAVFARPDADSPPPEPFQGEVTLGRPGRYRITAAVEDGRVIVALDWLGY